MRITAIKRATGFSPNHVDNDARILEMVADELRAAGHEVEIMTEPELIDAGIGRRNPEAVVNMCRDERSLRLLADLQARGVKVVNSPRGIANCNRETLTRLLLGAGVPHPESLILDTAVTADVAALMTDAGIGECWVKRADCQTMQREDVAFCTGAAEVEAVLADYKTRGIPRAVVSRHLRGDLIKFYSVVDSDFFCWFYPFDRGHSKFGYEEVNGRSSGIKFSEERLRQICADAARCLDVRIYGGDAVIDSDGSIRLIDFNDWPSFAPCREEGAKAISESIQQFL